MVTKVAQLPLSSNIARYAEAVQSLYGVETAISMVPEDCSPKGVLKQLEVVLQIIVRGSSLTS